MEVLTGSVGMIICFVAGSIAILVEAFMPGFGGPGIIGIILEILAIILTGKLYGTGWALLAAVLVLLLVGGAVYLSYRSAMKGRLSKSDLVLKQEDIPIPDDTSALKAWIGRQAVTVSPLRPAGFVEIDGNRLNAATSGGFLEKGTAVEVTGIEGDHLVVKGIE